MHQNEAVLIDFEFNINHTTDSVQDYQNDSYEITINGLQARKL